MTLNVNLMVCRQSLAYCYQTAKVGITRFSLESTIHLNYPHIKFEDEVKRDSLQSPSIISDQPVVCRL